jgi:capsular exopolysaccharide synthesis family protein
VHDTAVTDRGDLGSLMGMLRRRAWIVGLAVLAAVAASLVFSAAQTEKYKATSTLLFRPLLLDLQVSGQPLQFNGDATRAAATNAKLVTQSGVLQRAAVRLGPAWSEKDVKDAIQVKAPGQTDLVNISAEVPGRVQSARVANTVAEAFVATRRDAIVSQIDQAIANVRRQLAQQPKNAKLRRAYLQTNLTKFQTLRSVEGGDAQIANRATPPGSPSSPKTLLNAVIGGLLGLLIGLGLALLAESVDRRVRRPEDLERALGLPVLTSVPRSRALGRPGLEADAGPELEAFRRLRANLRYYGTDRELNSVVVTSVSSQSGKTTVALHLAATAAATGSRVLLIEADLRRPRLREQLSLPEGGGLAGALLAGSSDPDAFAVRRPGRDSSRSGTDWSFDVIPAGQPTDHASELLDSDAMRNLLFTSQRSYDLVIIDAPPPGYVSDAIPLMEQADGVIVVARMGREPREELERLRGELSRLEVEPVGAVATFARRTRNPYVSS